MQRRYFVNLAAYTAAALAFPLATGCSNKQIKIESQPLLFSHLVDVKTIIQTGVAYRKANRNEDDKNNLRKLLSPGDNSDVRSMLDNAVKNDFKTGKIAIVKGWVLSVTEARQCALFSILQS
jgi:hypothetical protein